MNVRYQADADLNQVIVTGVLRREPTVDFQTATAAGLEGVKDSEVLAIAARQKRILVSHDRKTMPSEFANPNVEVILLAVLKDIKKSHVLVIKLSKKRTARAEVSSA